MLRIKIDLVPYGKEEWTRSIGEMEIINDGSGDHVNGNYIYEIWDGAATIKGELKNHDRTQNVFKLLQAVLNKAL